jgi:hypothetical protein
MHTARHSGGSGAPAPILNMRFSPKKIYALALVRFWPNTMSQDDDRPPVRAGGYPAGAEAKGSARPNWAGAKTAPLARSCGSKQMAVCSGQYGPPLSFCFGQKPKLPLSWGSPNGKRQECGCSSASETRRGLRFIDQYTDRWGRKAGPIQGPGPKFDTSFLNLLPVCIFSKQTPRLHTLPHPFLNLLLDPADGSVAGSDLDGHRECWIGLDELLDGAALQSQALIHIGAS